MGLDNPYKYLILYNAQGEQVAEPFVEVGEGLWSPDRTRLTLLFHPGRIKRGVGPHMTMGPVFKTGNHYKLEISDSWPDANRNPLEAPYQKSIYAIPEARIKVQPQFWKLNILSPGSNDALTINFGKIMDSALALRLISVLDQNDQKMEGTFTLGVNQSSLSFKPIYYWITGVYTIRVDAKIEDISGNSTLWVFDTEGEVEKNSNAG